VTAVRICACSASARCVLCAHASVLYADTWPFLRCAFRTLRLFYAPSPVPRCADRVLTEWVLSRSVLCTRTEAHIRTGKGKGSTEDDVLAIQEGAAEDGDEEARSCVCRAVRKKRRRARRRALLCRHRTEASVQASCAPPLPLTPRNYAPQGPRLRHPLLTLYGRPPPLDVSWRVTGPAEQSRTPRDCGAGRVTVTPPAGQSFPRGAGSERGRRALAYDIAY